MTDQTHEPFDVACFCTQSRRLARNLTEFYDAAIAPSGLKVTQFSLLRAIGRMEAPSLTALATHTGLDRSTLGRNLRVLEKDGLVLMAPGRDSRTRVVQLTETAKAALTEAQPLWTEIQTQLARTFSPETLAALRTLSRASADL